MNKTNDNKSERIFKAKGFEYERDERKIKASAGKTDKVKPVLTIGLFTALDILPD